MKTLIFITGLVGLMAVNPLLAALYLSTVMVVAAAWYLSKLIAWLLKPKPHKNAEQAIGYESLNHLVASPEGQTRSTVFYGSKHAACDKPYQHQNGQTGPPTNI